MDILVLRRSLQELTAANLLLQESPDELTFRHALTREAVYSTLLQRQRKHYHRLVAETLEQLKLDSALQPDSALQADSVDAFDADLAMHYTQAQVWDKALEYSRRAGERAQRMFAPREAVEHWTRALEAARQLPDAHGTAFLRSRGQAFETLGEFERAQGDYEASLLEARRNGASAEEWQALIDLGFLWASRDYHRTGEYFQQALALARELSDQKLLGHSLNRVGNFHVNVEQPREAQTLHEEALQIFQASHDKPGLAETHDLLGLANILRGEFQQGASHLNQAITLFRELDDRRGLASALANFAERGDLIYDQIAGELDSFPGDPIVDAEDAIRISREIGWRSGESYALTVLGSIQGSRGDWARGLESAELALQIAQEIEHLQWTTMAQLALGILYANVLALERARSHLERALALARRVNSVLFTRECAGCLASVLIQYGDEQHFQLAERALSEVFPQDAAIRTFGEWFCALARAELALAREQGEETLYWLDRLMGTHPRVGMVLYLRTLRGEALMLLHRFAQAEAILTDPASASIPFSPWRRWRYHIVLGQVLRRRRQLKAAAQEFESARETIERLAERVSDPDLARAFRERALAQVPLSAQPSAIHSDQSKDH